MQSEEQRLIQGLFQRLKQAEKNTGPRDIEADQQIQNFIQEQPAAPYYMAQSILIQEAALNRLGQQLQQLKNEVEQLKISEKQRSGNSSFLGRFFKSRDPKQATTIWGDTTPQKKGIVSSWGTSRPQPTVQSGYAPPTNNPQPTGGFLYGALQTAAGVAGGVAIGNMLTNMFHHSEPQEIVNIIDNPATSSFNGGADSLLSQNINSENLDVFNDLSERHFLDQKSDEDNTDYNDFSADSFNTDDDFI